VCLVTCTLQRYNVVDFGDLFCPDIFYKEYIKIKYAYTYFDYLYCIFLFSGISMSVFGISGKCSPVYAWEHLPDIPKTDFERSLKRKIPYT
jgi:hypothetical protein